LGGSPLQIGSLKPAVAITLDKSWQRVSGHLTLRPIAAEFYARGIMTLNGAPAVRNLKGVPGRVAESQDTF
jgi:hypothetical protein